MKPVCIIPARNGSKGIPNKNITKILGTPLIGHVIRNVRNSKIFSHVIVSTEDRTIAKIAKKYGAEVPFLRSKKLADDFTPDLDVLIDCIKKISSQATKYHFCLYPTTTLLFKKDLINSFKKIKKLTLIIWLQFQTMIFLHFVPSSSLEKTDIEFNSKKCLHVIIIQIKLLVDVQ